MRLVHDEERTDSGHIERDVIEGNYLFSMRFILFTIPDITMGVFNTLGIVLAWLQAPASNQIFELNNAEAGILYLFLAFLGFLVGAYSLDRVKRNITGQQSIRVSIPYLILMLSPPFFVVSILLALAVNFAFAYSSIILMSNLFYGPGLGLLIARLLYFVFESRFWRLEPMLSEKPSSFPNVHSYSISRR